MGTPSTYAPAGDRTHADRRGSPTRRDPRRGRVQLEVDGRQVELADEGISLLEALRDRLGVRSPKDGCAPQGQCGCCTVLVDGAPRVACVTPLRRVRGRSVVTVDGLDAGRARHLGRGLHGHRGQPVRLLHAGHHLSSGGGPHQGSRRRRPGCGRPRPGGPPLPVHRLAARPGCLGDGRPRPVGGRGRPAGDGTGGRGAPWRTGARAHRPGPRRSGAPGRAGGSGPAAGRPRGGPGSGRLRRRQRPPADALVAVPDGAGGWAVGRDADRGPGRGREGAGPTDHRRVAIRRSTCPTASGTRRCARGWVEPAYLEPDAAWCAPGAEPVGPLCNGGAFGGKVRVAGGRGRPASGRRAGPSGPGAPGPGGRGPLRSQAASGRRRGPGRRHRRPAHRGHPGRRRLRGRRRPRAGGRRRSPSPGPPPPPTPGPPARPRPSSSWPAPPGGRAR